MDTISKVLMVAGALLLAVTVVELIFMARRMDRMAERNAAQAVIIAGMENRLAGLRPIDRESGISGPSGIDRGSQATQVPPGPEIASGGALIRKRSDRVRTNLVAEDYGDVAELEVLLASGIGPDPCNVSEKPDTDISANKGA